MDRKPRKTIGFLLASLNTGASRALWPGLLEGAKIHDVNLISFPGGRLSASTAFEKQRNKIFDLANAYSLDGLVTWASSLGGVLSPAETSAFHERYQGLPMVSLAQFMERLPTVAVDSYQGMRVLLNHLIKVHKFKKLAFIRGPEEHYYAQERYRAYLDTLQANDLPIDPNLVTRPLLWESGTEAIRILLDERKLKPGIDFQAVVAVSDMLAIWVLKTLQSRGYEVPRDVAVTGFNNSIEERLATPPLTTVDLPFFHQGAKAVDMLLAQINGETVPPLMTLPSSLIVRQSCGCISDALTQASYLPDSNPDMSKPSFNLSNDLEGQDRCLAELLQAYGEQPSRTIENWMRSLIDGIATCLNTLSNPFPQDDKFLTLLDDILLKAMREQQDILAWNNVISVLRRWSLSGLSKQERADMETIFGLARVVISEAEKRSLAYWQWQSERLAENLRETNRALLTTFNIHQLGEVLFEHLPGLGIPSAFMVLYEDVDFSRLMMAYTEQGKAAIEPAGWRFPTKQLLPQEFLPQDRRYSLVLEPLYFQEKSLGYAVFEIGPRDSNIYELVRANLSSAIQGAFLFDEIQQARLTAEKADHIKTRLLANVSHELRTPLNIIINHTQNLLSLELEAVLKTGIQNIQDHAEHQLRVINDLLDLSRAEIDELDLTLEVIDPRPLLIETFQSIEVQGSNPNVHWQLLLPDRLPLIRADAVRFRQALLNLLSNARKFTETGQIELGAEVTPPFIHFWVSDTGWGISPEQQERIFEPFVTMEHNRKISGGIGLGLSITRHLVALHGGKMTLDSVAGKGSKFHIYLPLPALEQNRSSTESAQAVLLQIASTGYSSPEIQSICKNQNLQLCVVSNVDELDVALSATRPLAVAWDLSHAKPGDWNLVRRLRSHPTYNLVPILIYAQETDLDTPDLKPGLTGFVTKASNSQTLLDTLNALCPSVPSKSILIVDDDPDVQLTHRQLVEKNQPGCSIITAGSGEAALEFMKNEVPALVLLDLVMPGMSGADVLDSMRADPRLRPVPVIILSSKLLSLDDVKRLEHHTRVTLQSKGIWSEAETAAALNRSLFGADTLPPHTSALVKRAVAYLQQNFSHPLSRWEIADAIGVSEDYLTRVFNRELEISPWDYLIRYRILQAQEMLRNSSRPISNIVHMVGFKDQSYFTRVFSKITGVSPQAYRNAKNSQALEK